MTPRLRNALASAVGVLSIGLGAFAASRPDSAASSASVHLPPLTLNSPTDWVSFQNTYFTPVADPVSRGLLAASVAFDAKDKAKAASELRDVGFLLGRQAAEISRTKGAGVSVSDKRLQSAIETITHAADEIAAGRLNSRAEFDRAFNESLYADLDRRWRVADVPTWYPVSAEPQRHFERADAAYASGDLKACETELRKAAGFLRLEAARADAAARRRLDHSVAELDRLANLRATTGAMDPVAMKHAFARADLALTLSHHQQADDAFSAGHTQEAGYDMRAGALDLQSAAAWTSDAAKAAAADAVEASRRVGDELVEGDHWTNLQVKRGLRAMNHAYLTLAYQVVAPRGSQEVVDAAGRRP